VDVLMSEPDKNHNADYKDNQIVENIGDQIVAYKDKWENIGYHRIYGSFLWNIIFAIIAAGYVLILPLFVPYPESMGFYNILTGIFKSIFTLADLGLSSALSRFVAEYRVKDPQRTIQYVGFFIWFQAFTGLIQTTVVSLIGLYGLRNGDLSFMPWMFLWLSIVQYPGWLGVFNEALKGFQQYGKVALAGVLNGVLIQTVTLVIGAQLGAYLGNQNPQIGGVMGAAIGLVIGYYVDDFAAVLITGHMFAQVIKPMNYRMRDIFSVKITKTVMKESIQFGVGVMLFVLTYESVGTIIALIYASTLPNYSTFSGTLSVISPIIGLAETVNGLHIGNHRSAVSEAYFNKKPNYAVYILSNGFRTMGQITFFITPIVLLFGPTVMSTFFPDYMQIFYMIFVWKLIFSTIFQHSHMMNEVLIGTGHHKFNIAITIGEQIITLVATIICIRLELGIFVLIIPPYFQTAFKQGLGWWYINKYIINLRINVWQNWISTFLSGVVFYIILWLLFNGLSRVITPLFGNIGTIIIFILAAIYVLPGPFYYLPLGFLGGYDDHTMEDFRKSVELAGPSKFIVTPWYQCAKIGARFGVSVSHLHGRFPMYYKNVAEEIQELMTTKSKADLNHKTKLDMIFE
jgi:O-antigen/teichoic acid export membrane protein